MKITKEHIGQWVIVESICFDPVKVLSISSDGGTFFGENKRGVGCSFCSEASEIWFAKRWVIIDPPKQKKLWAPAIYTHTPKFTVSTVLSVDLFSSEDDAKNYFSNKPNCQFLKWPAIPNKEGYYEVEE